jgi:hypothetical protein
VAGSERVPERWREAEMGREVVLQDWTSLSGPAGDVGTKHATADSIVYVGDQETAVVAVDIARIATGVTVKLLTGPTRDGPWAPTAPVKSWTAKATERLYLKRDPSLAVDKQMMAWLSWQVDFPGSAWDVTFRIVAVVG